MTQLTLFDLAAFLVERHRQRRARRCVDCPPYRQLAWLVGLSPLTDYELGVIGRLVRQGTELLGYVTTADLATWTGTPERTLRNMLKHLQEAGFVAYEHGWKWALV